MEKHLQAIFSSFRLWQEPEGTATVNKCKVTKPTNHPSNFHLYKLSQFLQYLAFAIYGFSLKAEIYSHLKELNSFNSYKSCAYNQEQFSAQSRVVIMWFTTSILKHEKNQKIALVFDMKKSSEFAEALPYSMSKESQTDSTSRHLGDVNYARFNLSFSRRG